MEEFKDFLQYRCHRDPRCPNPIPPCSSTQRSKGVVSASSVKQSLGWIAFRLEAALRPLLSQGMVWVDAEGERNGGVVQYWFPSIWAS